MAKKPMLAPKLDDMGEKLDGIIEFRKKVCEYLNGEITFREKALNQMEDHPLVEGDKETRMMREQQCRDLRMELKLLRSNLNTIERML